LRSEERIGENPTFQADVQKKNDLKEIMDEFGMSDWILTRILHRTFSTDGSASAMEKVRNYRLVREA